MTDYLVVPVAGPEPRTFDFQSLQLIWLFLALLEGAFALRLLLAGAAGSAANLGGALLTSFTGFFLLPFAGLATALAGSGAGLAATTVMAMLVYAVLGVALQRAAWIIFYRPYVAVPIISATILNQRTQ